MRFIGNLTVFPVHNNFSHRLTFDEVTAMSWRTTFWDTICLLSSLDVQIVTHNWSIYHDDRE